MEKPANATSLNHPMFGFSSERFYCSLLGINPVAPGFQKIRIKPQPAGDLTCAKGSYPSIQGTVGSEWKKEGNRFHLQVVVPPISAAEVWLPAVQGNGITESGRPLHEQHLTVSRFEDG